jgi:rubredoxin
MQYICQICGYVYDEDKEGKKFEELAEDFKCPECKVGRKSDFKVVEPMVEETEETKEEEAGGEAIDEPLDKDEE